LKEVISKKVATQVKSLKSLQKDGATTPKWDWTEHLKKNIYELSELTKEIVKLHNKLAYVFSGYP
jgi:hypothetical protein